MMNRWIAGALGVALMSTTAQAATVALTPSESTLMLGDTLTLVVKNEGFTTPTGGADLSLQWDPAVVRVDSLAPVGPGFNFVAPAAPTGAEQTAGRMDLISLLAPLTGALPSGSFDSMQIGLTAVGLGTTLVELAGVWYEEDVDPIPVEYLSATVHVVPLPAAAWALLGALGVLGARLRRKG
jgi:hypothetical protein